MKWFAVLALLGVGLVAANPAKNILSDEYIEYINSVATTWKAGRNFAKNTPMKYIRGLLGAKTLKDHGLPVRSYQDTNFEDLPDSFDSRDQWPDCPSLSEIRDQSDCGSCWAIAAAAVMTDRQCIHKEEQFHYSTEDIMSCCASCGFGCGGGFAHQAMKYWKNHGVVSGGQYGSNEGCQPYSLPSCDHHVDGTLPDCETLNITGTPACEKTCERSYPVSYEDDKHFASDAYAVNNAETDIMMEIFTNGPVEAGFTVYSDFLSYTSGVYQKTPNVTEEGGHDIKILGWGVQPITQTKYWLCANSWNEEWGDKGYFKILRGQDECGIEDAVVGGIPA